MTKHSKENNDQLDIITVLINTDEPQYAPQRMHNTDAGADVRSREDITIPAGGVAKVPLGFGLETPHGAWVKIEGRSGLASKGIFPVGGVVDEEYRGELMAILCNFSGEDFVVNKGDRVAQIVVHANYNPSYNLQSSFSSESARGDAGFGSTGSK